MSTILYLSNRLVQAVEIRGKGFCIVCQDMAPEGSIINGIITDEEVFLDWIKKFFIKNKLPRKECTLVVNSTQLNCRMLELPKAGNTEIRRMIEGEFADSRTDDTIFAYHVLGAGAQGKMQRILAVAGEKRFFEAYVHLFIQAGIEITAILPALSNFVRRFMEAPEIQKKNCIVQILDEQEIISILFVKGMYQYSQRDRIFFTEDQDMLATKAGEVVDRLVQFASSQHIEDPIETLYLCGLKQEELKSAIEENVHFTQEISPQIFKDGELKIKFRNCGDQKVGFIYPIGSLQKNEKQLDFLRQMKSDSRENAKRKNLAMLMLPAAVVLVICIVITVFLGSKYISANRELKRLQDIMQDAEMVESHTTYELADANIKKMEQKMQEAEDMWEHLMSYPTFYSGIKNVLSECAESEVTLEIKSFNRDSGVLTFSASAENVIEINGFIGRLKEQEMFESVEYSGYTLDAGKDSYSIHVVCAMAESAGR